MTRNEELAQKTLIISVGRISTQFLIFCLLPFYTAFLSAEQFGVYDLIFTIIQVIVPITSLSIDQGVFRELISNKSDNKKTQKVVSSGFALLGGMSLLSIFIFFITKKFFPFDYQLVVLLIIISTAFSNFFQQVARGQGNTLDYAFSSFSCSLLIIILNIIFIAFLGLAEKGMLIALLSGNVFCSLFLLVKLKIYKFISFAGIKKEFLKKELTYSLPLIPNQLSIWVLNFSDRIIVSTFLGLTSNGYLAISHKFPAILMTIFNFFMLAWHEVGTVHFFDEDRDRFFTEIMEKIISIFSTLCLSTIVFLPLVFNLFVNSAYNESYLNIPIYLVASLLNVVIGTLGVVYVASKKTLEIAKTTFIAAIINIVVNIVLIDYIGLFAASISTLMGYLIALIYRIIDTKKFLKIKYNSLQIICIVITLAISTFIYYLNNKYISFFFLPVFIIFEYFSNRSLIRESLLFLSNKIKLRRKIPIKLLLTLVVSLLIIGVGEVVYHKTRQALEIHSVFSEEDIEEIIPNNTIFFDNFGEKDFTCTGFTFDSTNFSYWIGDYGTLNIKDQPYPRIIEVNKDFDKKIREIRLDFLYDKYDTTVNLQGIAFDAKDDALWLAIGDSIIQVSKEGKKLNSIKMQQDMANGICYNEIDDTLWVLCTTNYLIHINKKGKILKQFPFNYYAQDHICFNNGLIYVTVGADYRGDHNYVCEVDPETGNIIRAIKTLGSNSIEGICFVNKKMFIVNDGFYHSDVIGKSYISEYLFE